MKRRFNVAAVDAYLPRRRAVVRDAIRFNPVAHRARLDALDGGDLSDRQLLVEQFGHGGKLRRGGGWIKPGGKAVGVYDGGAGGAWGAGQAATASVPLWVGHAC